MELNSIYDYPKKYYFDEVILSNEVGFRKPDKEIFEYTLNTLKLPAKECLFIDDLVKNIIPAKENFGFNCILYQNFNNLIKDMLGIDFSANCRKLFKSTLLGEEYETME